MSVNLIEQLRNCISWIYTPGDRPERFHNIKIPPSTGRILDLEDAVAPDKKKLARENIVTFLSQHSLSQATEESSLIAVRINHRDNRVDQQDLAALDSFGQQIFIVLPKTENRLAIDRIDEAIPYAKVIILVESAYGLLNVSQFISHPNVVGVMLGAADLASDLGAAGNWMSLLYARQTLLLHAKVQKLLIWDSPYFDLYNQKGLAEETHQARDLGFSGKVAIHPGQITIIEEAFAPTSTEISWAETVISIIESGKAVTMIDGKFIDKAMLDKAKQILERGKSIDERVHRRVL